MKVITDLQGVILALKHSLEDNMNSFIETSEMCDSYKTEAENRRYNDRLRQQNTDIKRLIEYLSTKEYLTEKEVAVIKGQLRFCWEVKCKTDKSLVTAYVFKRNGLWLQHDSYYADNSIVYPIDSYVEDENKEPRRVFKSSHFGNYSYCLARLNSIAKYKIR